MLRNLLESMSCGLRYSSRAGHRFPTNCKLAMGELKLKKHLIDGLEAVFGPMVPAQWTKYPIHSAGAAKTLAFI